MYHRSLLAMKLGPIEIHAFDCDLPNFRFSPQSSHSIRAICIAMNSCLRPKAAVQLWRRCKNLGVVADIDPLLIFYSAKVCPTSAELL